MNIVKTSRTKQNKIRYCFWWDVCFFLRARAFWSVHQGLRAVNNEIASLGWVTKLIPNLNLKQTFGAWRRKQSVLGRSDILCARFHGWTTGCSCGGRSKIRYGVETKIDSFFSKNVKARRYKSHWSAKCECFSSASIGQHRAYTGLSYIGVGQNKIIFNYLHKNWNDFLIPWVIRVIRWESMKAYLMFHCILF